MNTWKYSQMINRNQHANEHAKIYIFEPFNFIITLKVESLLRELNPNLKRNFAHVQQQCLAPTTLNPTPKFQP